MGRFHVGTLTGGLCRAHMAQYAYTSLCGCYMLVTTHLGVSLIRGVEGLWCTGLCRYSTPVLHSEGVELRI